MRFWKFLSHEIRRLETAGQMSLPESHACLSDVHERINFLRKRLGPPPLPETPGRRELAAADGAAGHRAATAHHGNPPRSAVDPVVPGVRRRLFVLGLVLFLYTKGIFENPGIVAVCLGGANLAVLMGGWALLIKTRYHLAGRAMTLLACLIMPLNLWFYHAQNLITLQGHLWVAGVVVCGLYAASAWVLKDWMFVPVLMGGVAMTGLLLLADLGRFWEIAGPSTLLVVLGLIAIHVERAFAPDDGPFGRRKFGLAFFFSGQVLLGRRAAVAARAHLPGIGCSRFSRPPTSR